MNSGDDLPNFPYYLIWPGFGNTPITMRELHEKEEELETLNSVADQLAPGARSIERHHVAGLVAQLQLDEELRPSAIRQSLTLARFLASVTSWSELGIDPQSTFASLGKAEAAARTLLSTLEMVRPQSFAVLDLVRRVHPDVLETKAPSFFSLSRELTDFAMSAKTVAEDLARGGGRPPQHVRDTVIRLCIQFLEEHGVADLQVSKGNKARSEPHLKGRAGAFLRDLFAVAAGMQEQSLAPIVSRVLRNRHKFENGQAG